MISALLPVRNGGLFLREAVSSILGSADVAELVVQDGESTDGSLEVLSEIDDGRLQIVSDADGGQADALNRALARASYEWLLWVNADDVIHPAAFARLADTARLTTRDVVYGDFELIRADGSHIRICRTAEQIDPPRLLDRGISLFSGSMLMRKKACVAAGGFDPTLSFCMDYDLVFRLALQGSFEHVPGVMAALRMHEGSKSVSSPWGFFREYHVVQKRYRQQVPGWSTRRIWSGRARMAATIASTRVRYSRLYSSVRRESSI
jgi:glycosyltransferase involved in cell wall biosynthesis